MSLTQNQFVNTFKQKIQDSLERDFTVKETKIIVNNLSNLISEEVRDSGSCIIPGVGKITLKTRPKRKGRNPRTGETIMIPEKTLLRFKFVKTAKENMLGDTELKMPYKV